MQVHIQTSVIVNAVLDAFGVVPQVLILDGEDYYALNADRPMIGVFCTEGDTVASAKLVSEVLRPLGFEQWGHGAGKTLVVDGFTGEGGLFIWGKLPWELHTISQ